VDSIVRQVAAETPEQWRQFYESLDSRAHWTPASSLAHPRFAADAMEKSICIASDDPLVADDSQISAPRLTTVK
jgi:hypothetical protein